jgi:hypothetical protein
LGGTAKRRRAGAPLLPDGFQAANTTLLFSTNFLPVFDAQKQECVCKTDYQSSYYLQ